MWITVGGNGNDDDDDDDDEADLEDKVVLLCGSWGVRVDGF